MLIVDRCPSGVEPIRRIVTGALRWKHYFYCVAVAFFLFLPTISALEVPKRSDGYVTDKAGLLSPSARAKLEDTLKSFEDKTSNQIVVVTFPSLGGQSLEDFSIHLAETWKVGQKGKDNGVIFLIFKNDRKMRIEVGYGLEGVLPDAVSGQIISRIVAPHFRTNNYEKGVFAGVDAIIQAIQREFKGTSDQRRISDFGKMLLILAIFLFFYFWVRITSYRLGSHRGKYGGFWVGGGSGGGGFGGGGFSGGGGSFGGGGASGGW